MKDIEDDYIEIEVETNDVLPITLKDNPIIIDAYGIVKSEEVVYASINEKDVEELEDRIGGERVVVPYLQHIFHFQDDIELDEDGYEIMDLIIPFSEISDESMEKIKKIMEEA